MSIQLRMGGCGGEISEKQSLLGIEIFPHRQLKCWAAFKNKEKRRVF